MDKFFYMGLFTIGVFLSSCTQILLKKSANQNHRGYKIYFNKEVIIGYSIFLSITLANTFFYRFIELSTGVLLESLSYVFIPILSVATLREEMSKKKFAGIALIISGVAVFAIFGGN